MRFCPDCGNPHECTAEGAVSRAAHVELEIARVNADRDIRLARIGARQDREALDSAETIAETEAGAEIVSSVAAAEIIAGEETGEAAETGEPIVVEVPEPEPAPEPEPDMVPPVAESHGGRSRKQSGWWDGYR